jgi:drug/metabolite transporter (DMT)-like permease
MNKTIPAPAAHFLALFTIAVWGTTFIASKVLLAVYSPLQIMLMRFFMAYVMLWILRPKLLRLDLKGELGCILLGLFGCTLYFLAENYALTFTLASNVSIILAMAPMLTAVLAHIFLHDEKLNRNIFFGFAVAIAGVALVVFNGTVILKINPVGDLLSFGAALCWAVYSVLLKKHLTEYDSLLLTRRVMFWGFVTALPVLIVRSEPFPAAPLADFTNLFCILYLGILGSGFCYIFWNMATKRLGTVVTNNYIYFNPFFTLAAAGIFLDEPISLMGAGGSLLILLGIFISDRKKKMPA